MSDTPEASFTIKHETSDTKGRYVVELNGAKAQGELFRGYLADLDTKFARLGVLFVAWQCQWLDAPANSPTG